jgi:hypothetical protein
LWTERPDDLRPDSGQYSPEFMPEQTRGQISNATRLSLYVRMTLAAGLLGIALGYYLQIIGRIDMTGFQIFAFAVRGMIVGALIWAFELWGVVGPTGSRLASLTPPARFAARVAVYLILGELGYWIGEAIFEPKDILDLFQTANGPN